MIKTPKAIVLGKKMRDISTKYLNKNVKLFKATEEGFEDDIQMIYKDAAGLYMIGSYMLDGNFDAAMSVASELDTLVRDEIPNSVWKYLQKYTIDQE